MSNSNIIKYKEFHGSIEVSIEDDCLCGQVLFIRDVILYCGDNVSELRQAFEDTVDEYLADCEELGRKPDKPCSGTFNVRIAPEMHKALLVKAHQSHGGVMNKAVAQAIGEYLDDAKEVNVNLKHEHTQTVNVEFKPEQQPSWVVGEATTIVAH